MTDQSDAALLADGSLLEECYDAIEAVEKLEALIHKARLTIEARIFAAKAYTPAGRALQADLAPDV